MHSGFTFCAVCGKMAGFPEYEEHQPSAATCDECEEGREEQESEG